MTFSFRATLAKFLLLVTFLVLVLYLSKNSFSAPTLSPSEVYKIIKFEEEGGSGPNGTRPSCVITSSDLRIGEENTITADVTDSDGNLTDAYLFIKSPSTKSYYNKAFYELMACTGTEFSMTCKYTIEPNSSWGVDAKIEVSGVDDGGLGEYCSKIVRVISPASPTPIQAHQSPSQTPTISSPNVRPTVKLSAQELKRYEGNQITANITDPDGDADALAVLIYIKSPSTEEAFRVNGQKMPCAGTGASLNCSYVVRPDSNWGNDALIVILASDKVGKGPEAKQNVLIKPEIVPSPTPSPTPTPSPSPTLSPSPTQIPTPTPSPTPTVKTTPSVEKTAQPSPTQSVPPFSPVVSPSPKKEEKMDTFILIATTIFVSAIILALVYYVVRKKG
ncbi:MAG: hypothetical protein N3F05_02875 [Candidatus Diapherotrites archaeon]|nr:hypothetical protein [Candidatus Diapherotrites archaeon]